MKTSDLSALEYQKGLSAGRGLRAKKNKDGSCSFLLMKKPVGAKVPLRLKLGTWHEISIDEAGIKAQKYRNLIEEDLDPRDYEKQQPKEKQLTKQEEERKGITLWQLHEEYMQSWFSLVKHTAQTKKIQNKLMLQLREEFLEDSIQDTAGPRLCDYYQYWVSQRISKQTGKPAVNQMKEGLRDLQAAVQLHHQTKAIPNRKPMQRVHAAGFAPIHRAELLPPATRDRRVL